MGLPPTLVRSSDLGEREVVFTFTITIGWAQRFYLPRILHGARPHLEKIAFPLILNEASRTRDTIPYYAFADCQRTV